MSSLMKTLSMGRKREEGSYKVQKAWISVRLGSDRHSMAQILVQRLSGSNLSLNGLDLGSVTRILA